MKPPFAAHFYSVKGQTQLNGLASFVPALAAAITNGNASPLATSASERQQVPANADPHAPVHVQHVHDMDSPVDVVPAPPPATVPNTPPHKRG